MIFTLSDLINIVALLMGLIGSFLMFYYSPNVDSVIMQSLDTENLKKKDNLKNKRIRQGMFFVMLGFALQFISIFVNAASKN
ncbi:MAG: hypothetical protein U0V03_11340 [Bacteroidia bacterium]